MKKKIFKNALSAKSAIGLKQLTGLRMLFYLTVIAINLSACSKDKGGGPDSSDDYYFRASLDGRKVDHHTVNFQVAETTTASSTSLWAVMRRRTLHQAALYRHRWTLRSGVSAVI